MTLESVPPYDPQKITESGGHAVVIGASIAGLLTARVLVDRYETVTLVERDALCDEAHHRRGIPQSHHIHAMQRAGQATLEDLFPGYGEAVSDAGGLVLDFTSDIEIFQQGDVLATGPTPIHQYNASRPVFEGIIRRGVAGLDGVTILDECHFREYLVDDRASTVEGVRVRTTEDEREIDAELVVDATGRTSRTPVWLETNGYSSPPRAEVSIDLAYSTALLERPPDTRRAVLVLPDPPRTRGAAVFPIENGRWLMTLAGMHGDHPPTDLEGIVDYAASLPVDDVSRMLDEHALVSEDVHHYPFPSSVRRRYEALDRFPHGLVVIGDAIASLNPIYGQGMSVAALEALQLHHTLARADRDELAPHFFERAARVVGDAWDLAVGADFGFPQTSGPKPFGADLLNAYVDRLLRKAHADGRLAEAFIRVVNMETRPTSLFRPPTLWRVLKPDL